MRYRRVLPSHRCCRRFDPPTSTLGPDGSGRDRPSSNVKENSSVPLISWFPTTSARHSVLVARLGRRPISVDAAAAAGAAASIAASAARMRRPFGRIAIPDRQAGANRRWPASCSLRRTAPTRHRRQPVGPRVQRRLRRRSRRLDRPSVGSRLQGHGSAADPIPRSTDPHADARLGTHRTTRASVTPTSDGRGRRAPGPSDRVEPPARCGGAAGVGARMCVGIFEWGFGVCRRGARAPGSR